MRSGSAQTGCAPPPSAASSGTRGHRWPSCAGSSARYHRIIYRKLDYKLSANCPAGPASTDFGEFLNLPLRPHLKIKRVSSSFRTAVKLLKIFVRLYARYFWATACLQKADDLRREGVWGRLLCCKRKSKYRPNICLSLSVRAACPLIDGADLRH